MAEDSSLVNYDVLQIGPIPNGDAVEVANKFKSVNTFILGGVATGGMTNMKKGYSDDAPRLLCRKAKRMYEVDYERGNAVPYNKRSQLNACGIDPESALMRHVIKIGWRNTIGRASYEAGKFVAPLISTAGANYRAVTQMWKEMHSEGADTDIVFQEKDTSRYKECVQIADLYVSLLENYAAPPSIALQFASSDFIRESLVGNYAEMLLKLAIMFDVPVQMWGSGKAGAWEKMWDTPGTADIPKGPEPRKYEKYSVMSVPEEVRKFFQTPSTF
ncbi:hypothetical protein CYMTET_3677 [Cymbomonas tetramitiformis]|uniref:Uncharacterized protein n=1 Tax=Cymbomonas tetramitiformis TaxID=36881 RepID=A0AAE0H2T2_9CHLO|nr:hypothetical protein CYMTET_3677 [Cymbomonas tetramitiformis]